VPRLRFALLCLLSANFGCAHCQRRDIDLPDDQYGPLPEGKDALLAESDRMVEKGPGGPSVARSYRAADTCVHELECGAEGRWRLARAMYFLTLTSSSAEGSAKIAKRCMDLDIEKDDPAEGHFYLALCMGARALAKNSEGLALIPKMLKTAETAAEKDPMVAHAGPHRLLGGIYLRAPAWPLSVGDIDEALTHLKKAAELGPQWPENHMMLAEALAEDDRKDEARAELEKAKELLAQPSADGWRDFWRDDLEKVEKKLGP
jgi:tetratricopeptide (TPR) repeat protein